MRHKHLTPLSLNRNGPAGTMEAEAAETLSEKVVGTQTGTHLNSNDQHGNLCNRCLSRRRFVRLSKSVNMTFYWTDENK